MIFDRPFQLGNAGPLAVGISAEQRVAICIKAKQVDRVALPPRLRRQCVDREVPLYFKLHRCATDKLHESLVGRIAIEQHGVDFFTVACARDVAEIDPCADRSRGPVPVDALDIGHFRLIPARLGVGEGVVDPALLRNAHDTIQFPEVVVAEGVDQPTPRYPFPRRVRW